MPKDFYPFVDADSSSDPGNPGEDAAGRDAAGRADEAGRSDEVRYATRIAVYDDMLSTPRVIVVEPADIRSYLEEVTNAVYRAMKEQGGSISLMVVRELVENFIHADFTEPIVSILDGGNTIRFADQGPGISDKELAFEFGVTSATREQKRYIRGTGAGLPMVEQYLENAGGAISIEDNIRQGTVVTVSIDPARVDEINQSVARGAVVRGSHGEQGATAGAGQQQAWAQAPQQGQAPYGSAVAGSYPQAAQPSYQQSRHEFSTIQQQPPLPAYSYPYQPYGQAAAQAPQTGWTSAPQVSERGLLALQFMAEHGSAGPTDLANAYGESTPTWSRELAKLSTTGLAVKQGQKRVLTDMGRAWLEQQAQ